MTEYASFYGKYIYAGEKLKNEPNLLSIIYDYRSWFVEHLQLAARSQNAYLIDGCSKMFEFAIETTISNHLSPINLLQEIKTLMFTTLTEIRNTAGTTFFLSDELIRFANGLFKSINEIPNTEFNDESLTAIKALSTDCFSDLNAILSKDADLISGTKLSEFILGNFFTSAISNAGKNVKF
ncbi:MAG: hypothetical protein MJ200_02805 [Mycoplasmoidaceae bacterium]|nr:hypothetical protein [Mycoplasmoidaceae bacterium]